MKKTKFQFLLFTVFVLFIAVNTVVFAGGGNQTPAAPQGSAAPAAAAQNAVKNMNDTGLPICITPQTFTIAIAKGPQTKNNFADKEISKKSEQLTNVVIDWLEIPQADYAQKVNLLIASGDLPDALNGPNDIPPNISVLASLGDIINKYAPNLTKLFNDRPDLLKALKNADGKIYSLPGDAETFQNTVPQNLFINKVWLDKLGLPVPKTTDDFYNTLKAFKDKDPGAAGSDFTGLSVNNSVGVGGIQYFFGAWGLLVDLSDRANQNYAMVKDNKVIFAPAQQGYKDGLLWLNKLYAAGLLDPESFTMTTEQYLAKFMNKDVLGSMISFAPDQQVGNRGSQDFVPVPPLKGPNGDQLWLKGQPGVFGRFAITKKCVAPEIIVRWFDNNMSSLEYALEWDRGPKGVAWDFTPDGKWKVLTENNPPGIIYGEWRHTITFGYIAPLFMSVAWVGPDAQEFTAPTDIFKVNAVKQYIPYAQIAFPKGFDDPVRADERRILSLDIDTYMRRFVSNSIMNGLTDVQWTAHLNTLQSLKVDRYVQLCQQFVDSLGQ
ncbi:MAG: extracellular solute-binding protein [Treponema sp.]|nr:extracellular solute-binding protein [Treponema sp.]